MKETLPPPALIGSYLSPPTGSVLQYPSGILYKVQQQVHQRMAEILATTPLRLDRSSPGRP
ncbi:MAG TPA: hypothetical protein VFB60_12755 [Ktedonobacteraceae bacterium]|nr:hypothetical protein [Ktedonobacteraceae bacterium]